MWTGCRAGVFVTATPRRSFVDCGSDMTKRSRARLGHCWRSSLLCTRKYAQPSTRWGFTNARSASIVSSLLIARSASLGAASARWRWTAERRCFCSRTGTTLEEVTCRGSTVKAHASRRTAPDQDKTSGPGRCRPLEGRVQRKAHPTRFQRSRESHHEAAPVCRTAQSGHHHTHSVLVGGPLPGRVRISEEDVDVSVDGDLFPVPHFLGP
jgi:hypothetical protein